MSLLTFGFSAKSKSDGSPATIVKLILNDLLTEVIKSIHKRKHENVSDKKLDQWKTMYPWLEVSESGPNTSERRTLTLTCNWCRSVTLKNTFTTGCTNIQKSTIDRHAVSADHQSALRCQEKKRKFDLVETELENFEIPSGSDNASSKIDNTDTIVFKTVYYAMKEELPSDKVNSLIDLQRMNGLNISYQNLSWDTVTDIQETIAGDLQYQQASKIRKSPFFSIMLDESQDLGVDKKLSICIRYVHGGEPVTEFLGNIKVDDGKAHTIVNATHSYLLELDLDPSKIVSLGSDGAAVMFGKKTGVGVQMITKYSPFMIHSHCIAHRLALAVCDVSKHVKDISTFRDRFNSLFWFFNTSAVRSAKLEQIQTLLNDPTLKIKEPHSVRWLSFGNAVSAVYRCYPSVVATLSSIATETKSPTAESLYKYFRESKTALVTAMVLDVHNQINILSKQLQKENLLFSAIQPLFEATIASLKNLGDVGGENEREMLEMFGENKGSVSLKGVDLNNFSESVKNNFKRLKTKYVESLIHNMEGRLEQNTCEILSELGMVLEPQNFDSELADGAVERLGDFYGSEKVVKEMVNENIVEKKVECLLDKKKLKDEWPLLKGMIQGSYKNLSTGKLCKCILTTHEAMMPNFEKLANIALNVCVTSVECERTFSLQNRLKSKYRCSLKAEKVNTLMKINMLGPCVTDYNVARAVQLWYRKKKRRKGRLAQAKVGKSPKAN